MAFSIFPKKTITNTPIPQRTTTIVSSSPPPNIKTTSTNPFAKPGEYYRPGEGGVSTAFPRATDLPGEFIPRGGGGGGTTPSPTGGVDTSAQEEAARKAAADAAAREAAELQARADAATKASERRRLEMLAERKRIKARAEEEDVSFEVASRRQYSARLAEQKQSIAPFAKGLEAEQKISAETAKEFGTTIATTSETVISKTKFQKTKDVLKSLSYGELGKKFLGFGTKPIGVYGMGISSAEPLFSFEDISTKAGLPGRVFGELVPSTPLGFALVAGGGAAITKTPLLFQKGVNLAVAAYGTKQIITPSTTIEKKIAGGLLLGTSGGLASYGFRRFELAKELKIYKEMLPKKQKTKFEKQMLEAGEITKKVEPKITELDLSRLTLLEKKPKAQEKLTEFFKKEDLIVGGSISQQTQIRGVKTKRPGDIDVYVKKSLFSETKAGERYAKESARLLKQTGIKFVRAKKGKVEIRKEKLLEFHPYKEYLRPNIEQVTGWYKPAFLSLKRTPSGIRILDIGIQYKRKLVGGYLEPFMTGKTRLKDIPAAMAIKESLLKEGKIKYLPAIKTKKDTFSLPKDLKIEDTRIFKGGGRGIKPSRPSRYSDYFGYKEYSNYRVFKTPKLPTIYPEKKPKKETTPYIPKREKKPFIPPPSINKKSFPSYPFLKERMKPTSFELPKPFSLKFNALKPFSAKFTFGGKIGRKPSTKPKRYKGREDIGISEGFTAHQLGLKPMKIKRTSIPKLERYSALTSLRRIPILR
jgi:hypothetical protein